MAHADMLSSEVGGDHATTSMKLLWNVPGIWYDIGSKETLEEASRIFAKK